MHPHVPRGSDFNRAATFVAAFTLPVIVAALAVILCGPQPTVRKSRLAVAANATAILLVVPVAPVLCTAGAPTASPAERQATRNTHAQPLLASEAGIHRMHEITLSRFGGLYGP